MALRYAVDTNVLLRLSHRDHLLHSLITTAMRRLVARDVELCFTPQNVGSSGM
jgi:predicted nucleic acid-binding protein